MGLRVWPWAWLCLLLCPALAQSAPKVSQWRLEDPRSILVIDTTKGRLFVELHPDVAPMAVQRIESLTRRRSYDGLLFHRVIEGFVAQTGDPGNHDGGKTELPNLQPEFTFHLTSDMPHMTAASPLGMTEGFIGALPYMSVAATQSVQKGGPGARAWITYCPAVMGMGRDAALDTANSEIFFMLGANISLDHNYTAVGRVILGQDVLLALSKGEPPERPDAMIRVQILADMPDAPRLEVLDTESAEFRARVRRLRLKRGADFSLCEITLPARLVSQP